MSKILAEFKYIFYFYSLFIFLMLTIGMHNNKEPHLRMKTVHQERYTCTCIFNEIQNLVGKFAELIS